MAQSLHIGLWGPCTNLPFGICAICFDLKVKKQTSNHYSNISAFMLPLSIQPAHTQII